MWQPSLLAKLPARLSGFLLGPLMAPLPTPLVGPGNPLPEEHGLPIEFPPIVERYLDSEGLRRLSRGDLAGARRHWEDRAHRGRDPGAWTGLALCHLASREAGRAAECLARALALEGEFPAGELAVKAGMAFPSTLLEMVLELERLGEEREALSAARALLQDGHLSPPMRRRVEEVAERIGRERHERFAERKARMEAGRRKARVILLGLVAVLCLLLGSVIVMPGPAGRAQDACRRGRDCVRLALLAESRGQSPWEYYRRAVDELQEAVRLDPALLEAHLLLLYASRSLAERGEGLGEEARRGYQALAQDVREALARLDPGGRRLAGTVRRLEEDLGWLALSDVIPDSSKERSRPPGDARPSLMQGPLRPRRGEGEGGF